MRLNISVNLDNDAFQDGNLGSELEGIFDYVKCHVVLAAGEQEAYGIDERFQKPLKDINGNTVGKFAVTTSSPSDIQEK